MITINIIFLCVSYYNLIKVKMRIFYVDLFNSGISGDFKQ